MNAEKTLETGRRTAMWSARIILIVAAIAALSETSCSKLIRTGQSPAFLIIDAMQAAPGLTTTFGAILNSDVRSNTGGIASDTGNATMRLVLKDPSAVAGPTDVNAITITQYHVEYIRGDGRNTQGVDVPFAFDGAVTVTVADTATVPFTVVRIQAKLEAPLPALAGLGGAVAISTIARVTFFGHDQNGRDVSVTGSIEVNFADWAG